jgi:acetyl-CoA hydrolase
MFADGIIKLVEEGVITNEKKTLHPGKIIVSFVLGNQPLFDFVDNNPVIEFHPSHYTNDPFIISRNEKMVAINSAIEVDLTGQVCADSIGHYIYSGFGGQVDFIRGAARSKGGKPIIALPSTAKQGTLSRITSRLTAGAGVTTSRGDVHYVVTEFGVANLFGKTIRQRVKALIEIAHPSFREELEKFAYKQKYIGSTVKDVA